MDEDIEKQLTEKYTELAEEFGVALKAVRNAIPIDIMGKAAHLQLEREDYRKIASGLFIEVHKKKGKGEKSKPGGPPTEKAFKFMNTLIDEKKDGKEIAKQFLETNGLKKLPEIDASQCSALIEVLKKQPKRK
jgi:hypothetical protein